MTSHLQKLVRTVVFFPLRPDRTESDSLVDALPGPLAEVRSCR
jgi:hypothetical protein